MKKKGTSWRLVESLLLVELLLVELLLLVVVSESLLVFTVEFLNLGVEEKLGFGVEIMVFIVKRMFGFEILEFGVDLLVVVVAAFVSVVVVVVAFVVAVAFVVVL